MRIRQSLYLSVVIPCCLLTTTSITHADILENTVSQGAVYNNAGTVTGNTPLVVDGGGGTSIDNTGTVTSSTTLTTLDVNGNIGTITNDTGAFITSTFAGSASGSAGVVDIDAGATVGNFINRGTMTSQRSDIIRVNGAITTLNNSGTIEKTSTQTFGNAIDITTGASVGTLINSGLISQSRTGDATFLLRGSLGALNNTGTIRHTAGSTAFYVLGSQAAPLTNDGTISSATARAIILEDNLTMTFINNGSILAPGGVDGDAIRSDAGSTLTFTNNNIVTGGVTGVLSSSTLNLTNNSAGVINGGIAGAVMHQTAGALTLVNAGTINGDIASTPNAAHNVTMNGGAINGNITLDGVTANSFAMTGGTITGDVDLDDNAGHTVMLGGGTIAGTFDMGDTAGGTAGINAGVNSIFHASNTGATALTGEGAIFDMSGAGTFRISGDVVDTGAGSDHILDINAGTLEFNTDSTIDGAIDADGSIVNIGNRTITVNGGSDFAADATLDIEIGTATGMLTDGTSNSTISFQNGSSLDVHVGSGTNFGTTYTIVDATGGTLNVSTANINIVNDLVRYKFDLQKIGETLALTPDKADITTEASNTGVNDTVDDAFNGDPILDVLNKMTSNEEITQAYETLESSGGADAISGSIALQNEALTTVENRILGLQGGGGNVAGSASRFLGFTDTGRISEEAIANALHLLGGEQDNAGLWAQSYGSLIRQDQKDGIRGYDATTAGVSFGADIEYTGGLVDKSLIGAAYSYGVSNVDRQGSNNETDIQSHQLTLYGSAEKDDYYMHGNLAYALNNYEGTRYIEVGGIRRTASSDYNGRQFGASAEVGKNMEFEHSIRFKPFIGLQYSHLNTDSYTETGAGNANLQVSDADHDTLIAKVGASISKDTQLWGYDFVPKFDAYYGYDLIDDEISINNSFAGGGASFKTEGLQPGRHVAGIGLGIKIAKGEGFELALQYGAELKEQYLGHSALINLRYDFD